MSRPQKVAPINPSNVLNKPEIGATEQLPPIPLEAIADLEDMRRKRAMIGIPGQVVLRIHDAPGKEPEWSVEIAEIVVRGRRKHRQ